MVLYDQPSSYCGHINESRHDYSTWANVNPESNSYNKNKNQTVCDNYKEKEFNNKPLWTLSRQQPDKNIPRGCCTGYICGITDETKKLHENYKIPIQQ